MIAASMRNDEFVMTEKDRQILEYICKDLYPGQCNVGDEEQYTETVESAKRDGLSPANVKQALDAMRIVFGCNPTASPLTVCNKIDRCINDANDEIGVLTRRIQRLTVDARMLALIKIAIDVTGLVNIDGKPI